jgi:hypothetical protein
MKEQLDKAIEEMHGEMRAALEKFTARTGLQIGGTKWDVCEVLDASGTRLVVRYFRMRSSMETKPS